MQLSETAIMVLDWYILLASFGAALLSFVLFILSLGDLRLSQIGSAHEDPDVTAAWEGVVQQIVRFVILVSCCALAISSLFFRPYVGWTVFIMLMLTIHLLIFNSIYSWVSRHALLKQSAVLRDPCTQCPWPDSPHKLKAQTQRAMRVAEGKPERIGNWGPSTATQQAHISTPDAEVHLTVIPTTNALERQKQIAIEAVEQAAKQSEEQS